MKKTRHLHLPRVCFVLVLAVFLIADLPGLVGWKTPYAQPSQRLADDNVSGISQAAPFAVEQEESDESEVTLDAVHTISRVSFSSYGGHGAALYTPGEDSLKSNSVLHSLYEKMKAAAYMVANEEGENGYAMAPVRIQKEKLSSGEIGLCLSLLANDCPEIFWMSRRYSYWYEGNDTVVQLYAYVSGNRCERMLNQVKEVVDGVIESLPPGLTELQREQQIYQWLAAHCTYDRDVNQVADNWRSYAAVGSLLDGKAVCEGYARALQLLLSQAGITCRSVTGTAEGGGHMWNMVKLGDDWVHVDLTWDDSGDEGPLYRYFNLPDTILQQTHTLSPDYTKLSEEELDENDGLLNAPVPVCNEDTYTYYRNFGIQVTESGEEKTEVVEAMVQAMQAGNRTVALYIPEELDYDEMIDEIFRSSGNRFMDEVAQANWQGADISYSDCVYYCLQEERGVCIVLRN